MLTPSVRHLRRSLRDVLNVYCWRPPCASIATSSLQCKGHSHWQNVARTKTARDGERSKMISLHTIRIQKAIMRNGYNTDVKSNRDLAREIEAAKLATVPMETINRQIERMKNVKLEREEYSFKLNNAVVVVRVLTMPRTSVKRQIRKLLTKSDLPLTSADDALAHFEEKGVIIVDAYMNATQRASLEHLEEVAIEVGAEEVEEITDADVGDAFAVICAVHDMPRISGEISKRGLTVHKAEEQLVPIVRVELEPAMREKLAELYAALQTEVSEIDSIFDNIAWPEN